MIRNTRPLTVLSACLATAGLLAACGGSDGGTAATPTPTPPATATTTVSGSVVKGPVSGSNVCAFKAVAAGKGDQIKCVTTNAAGGYTMDIEYTGDVVIEATGGTYTDEATNTTKTLSDPMQVVVASTGGATTGIVTPLTSVAYSLAKSASGGVTSVNFGTSAASVASQFQLTGINLASTVPVVTGTTNNYGNILRAVSKYVANGNTLAAFQAFSSPTTLQAGFASAYAAINGSTLVFTFNGGTVTPGTGTGTTPGTGTGTGNSTLTINVTASGFPSPAIVINNIPKPATQTEFCGELTNPSSQLTSGFVQSGGKLTINSCSFNGTVGNVSAVVSITSPVALTVPYTITYTYN